MPSKKFTFEGAQGESLDLHLDLPAGSEPQAYALLVHCFPPSKDLKAAHPIAQALTQEGVAVVRFDFAGLGENSADPNSASVEDVVRAALWLEDAFEPPQILIGHSLGGAAVLQAASRLPGVRAVATVAAPSEPEYIIKLLASSREEIEAQGEAEVVLGERCFTVKKRFLDDLNEARMKETIGSLGRPLLIFHSPTDRVVGIDNAAKIFKAAEHPKSFVSLAGADHFLTDAGNSSYVGRVVAAWAQQYIEVGASPAWRDDPFDNRVAARTEEGLRTELMVNGFGMVADEPVPLGGTETGPTPYDFLAAALGACTSMTLRMYADRKGWPLEAVTVTVKHSKAHARACETCEAEGPKLDHFERSVELLGPLEDAQRQRLLEIADRCPVHRTLEGDVHISTQLA